MSVTVRGRPVIAIARPIRPEFASAVLRSKLELYCNAINCSVVGPDSLRAATPPLSLYLHAMILHPRPPHIGFVERVFVTRPAFLLPYPTRPDLYRPPMPYLT